MLHSDYNVRQPPEEAPRMSIPRHPRTIQALAPEHLECRSMGHAWTHRDDHDHEYRRTPRGRELDRFIRDEECMRCGAERVRVVDIGNGLAMTRTIRYPDGYLLKGQERVTRYDALSTIYGVGR